MNEGTVLKNSELNGFIKDRIITSGDKIRFPVYLTEELEKTEISVLELSVRSQNCLHRAGFHTVGELVKGISGSEDLKRIRNCGQRSINEIMTALITYQFSILPERRRKEYLLRVYALSMMSPEEFIKLKEKAGTENDRRTHV